jgi:hypothetical protein
MASGAPAVRVPAPAPPAERPDWLWTPGLVVGAAGVASAVPMAIFWISGTSDIHQMKDSCAPSAGGAGCPADRVDSDRTKLVLGDVFLGIAVAGVATSAVLLFTHRAHAAQGTHGDATAFHLDASPMPGGAWVSAAARF